MCILKVDFLGVPSITLDGRAINISQRKLEALLFYIIYRGRCARNELVRIFWCDFEPEKARGNLRNSIYKLKQECTENLFLLEGKSYISINPELTLIKDVDHLMDSMESGKLLNKGGLSFMEGYEARGCEAFNEWVLATRGAYEQVLVEKMRYLMRHSKDENSGTLMQSLAVQYLKTDSYNEDVSRMLMRLYADKGAYNKSIEVYHTLSRTLESDLGVPPENETMMLYRQILAARENLAVLSQTGYDEAFPSRHKFLGAFHRVWEARTQTGAPYIFLALSEPGMGLEDLIDEALESVRKQAAVVRLRLRGNVATRETASFFQILEAIGRLFPQAWTHFSQLLREFNNKNETQANGVVISSLLDQLRESLTICVKFRPLIIAIECLEEIDSSAFSLLIELIDGINTEKRPFIFLISEKIKPQWLSKRLYALASINALYDFTLQRFSRTELNAYIIKETGDENKLMERGEHIFNRTAGNARLSKLILSRSIDDAESGELPNAEIQFFNAYLRNLTRNDISMLELLAAARDGLSTVELEKLSNCETVCVHSFIRRMLEYDLLQDTSGRIHFFMEDMRRYYYFNTHETLRLAYHDRLAKYFENIYCDNPLDLRALQMLEWNFGETEPFGRGLLYRMRDMEIQFSRNDELFPTLIDDDEKSIFLSTDEARARIAELEGLMSKIPFGTPENIVNRIYAIYYYIRGKMLIRSGDFENGVACIKTLFSLSLSDDLRYYAIHGHFEICYYFIKKNDADGMLQNLEEIGLERLDSYFVERGIWLRLMGLQLLIRRKYDESQKFIQLSIEHFESIPSSQRFHVLHIAGSYNYLADMMKYQQRYDEAFIYCEKAISLCAAQGVERRLDALLNNLGQILYHLHRINEAKENFEKSIEYYNRSGFYWERSIAENYLALIYCSQGETELSKQHRSRAELYMQISPSSYEIEVDETVRKKIMGDVNA